jgi:hypothetical protein
VGVFLVLGFFMTLYKLEHVTATLIDRHLAQFPRYRAALRLSRV